MSHQDTKTPSINITMGRLTSNGDNMSGDPFSLGTEEQPTKAFVFHDESKNNKYLYHGILCLEEDKLEKFLELLRELRKKAQCAPEKDIHFADLRGDSLRSTRTQTAKLWVQSLKADFLSLARYYALGVRLEHIEQRAFGEDRHTQQQNIYNRFFEIALYSALRWFYTKKQVIVKNCFSEWRDLAQDDKFSRQAPYKINKREAGITFENEEIVLVKGSHQTEVKNKHYLDFIQLVDVFLGSIRVNYDGRKKQPGQNEVADEMLQTLTTFQTNGYNPNSCLYKKFHVAWFPKNKLSYQEVISQRSDQNFFHRVVMGPKQGTFGF